MNNNDNNNYRKKNISVNAQEKHDFHFIYLFIIYGCETTI